MEHGIYHLIKFLQKNNILSDYIAEYNGFHHKSISNTKQLVAEWKKIKDERLFLQIMYVGFSNEKLSFQWASATQHQYSFWNALCTQFTLSYRWEVMHHLIPMKLKGQPSIDFIINEIKEIGMWKDLIKIMRIQFLRKIDNDEDAKQVFIKQLDNIISDGDPLFKILFNGLSVLMYTEQRFKEDFWKKLDVLLRRRLYALLFV